MVIPITETLDSIQESPYVHLKHADILYFLTLKKKKLCYNYPIQMIFKKNLDNNVHYCKRGISTVLTMKVCSYTYCILYLSNLRKIYKF